MWLTPLLSCVLLDLFDGDKGDSGETGATGPADADIDTDADADADGDADGDGDADVDGDSDTDADGDLDPDDELCSSDPSTPPPGGPDCISGPLACGANITATTEGGSESFEGSDYTHFFCFTNLDMHPYDGAERVYEIDLDGDVYATATLDAPCTATSMAAMAWGQDECPESSGVSACEGTEGLGRSSVTFGGYSGDNKWLLVIDTAEAEPSIFRLTLSCE
jgi:hypothetical protein